MKRHLAYFPFLIGIVCAFSSCQPVLQKMEPTLVCPLPIHRVSTLPSAFTPLSAEEKKQEWAIELMIGDVFAKEWDLYRAITCYKRAIILSPIGLDRRLQLDYNLIYCYYLGSKYQEALNLFEESELSQSGPEFPAFNNLLLLVYDSYLQTKQEEKAACVLEAIRLFSPESGEDLFLYQTLLSGDIEIARCIFAKANHQKMRETFSCYELNAKSPSKARFLNAILPGAGYKYVGQKQSAITSFVINTLFTLASYQFFRHGYPAAGAITASMEMGWYLGGINGAGIEAHEYNTRLFEGVSRKILLEKEAFPVLMLETSF
jgi:tetratricopeptide (TPR) repeat protein